MASDTAFLQDFPRWTNEQYETSVAFIADYREVMAELKAPPATQEKVQRAMMVMMAFDINFRHV